MSGSSLPVWVTIYLCGVLFVGIVSFINPYVPKDQKLKAKEKETREIYYRTRLVETFGIVVGIMIVIATIVAFIVEDYSYLVESFGGGILGHIIGVSLIIIGFFIGEIILIIEVILIEDIVIEDIKDFYLTRYDVIVMSIEEIRSSKLTENPHE